MKWQRGYRSGNVIDRRGEGPAMGNMTGLLPLASRFGWKGIIVLVVVSVIAYGARRIGGGHKADPNDEMVGFVGFVLDDAQNMWAREFEKRGQHYQPAHLVLFTDSTTSGCGL